MSDGTSVGKIGLDLEVNSDLGKQISVAAGKLGEQLQGALKNIGNIDIEKVTSNISNTLKAGIDKAISGINLNIDKVINAAGDSISETIEVTKQNALTAIAEVKMSITEIVRTIEDMGKNIKLPTNFSIPSSEAVPSVPNISPSLPRGPPMPTMPKVDVSSVNLEVLKAQIENISRSLEITNAKIEQQQEKLARLREAYSSTFNEARKNKLQEQILNTEAVINKLISTSDRLGFKLSDLDSQFELLSNSEKKAAVSAEVLNNKMKETGNASNKNSSSLKNLNRSTKEAGDSFRHAHSGAGMFFESMFKWGIVFPMIIRGLGSVASFMGSALMVNSQFANSFEHIKSNLYTAFMPIYQAILPALNTLMSALSTVTAYIASFTSALFGKTYNASFGAAKALQSSIGAYDQTEKSAKKAANSLGGVGKAAKAAGEETKKGLAGFDQINKLGDNASKTPATAGSGVVTPITPMANMAPIDSATSIWADKFKKILGTIFQPFKNAWAADGAGVVAEFNRAVDGTKVVLKHFAEALATPQVQLFLENIGRLGLAIIKLGLRIYDGFILPIIDWFINKLPGAAGGLNPILEAATKLVNYLSGDGFKYVQIFLALFTGWKAVSFVAEMARATAAIIANTTATMIDKAETLYIMGLYAKDFVISIGSSIKAWGLNAAAIAKNTMATIIDKGETLYLMALYAKDVVISVGKSVIAWGANALAVAGNTIALVANKIAVLAGTIAIGAWNVICGIATIATTAFGAAVAFLTSPIGLVILAIAALIAAGVLLYKHWDTVKAVASSVWGEIKNIFASFSGWLGSVFATDWSKHFGVIGNLLNAWLANVRNIFSGVKQIFSGIVDFVAGVFSGDWSRAWLGVKEIFSGIVSTFAAIMKAPLNGIIGLINGAIQGLNKMKVPDWVPVVGGQGVNLPKIPYLARGGVVDSPTLAMVGEAGKEAVMPLENNTGWINNLAGQIAAQIGGNESSISNNEILDILRQILKAISDQNGDLIIKIGESEFARIAIAAINKRRRQTGVNELLV